MKIIQSILGKLSKNFWNSIVRKKGYGNQKEFLPLHKQEEVFLFI